MASRVAAFLAVASALAAPAAASAGSASPLRAQHPLSNTGRWLTDSAGRVVILHGFNMVYKRPPYAPGAVGFGADDADFLRRNGFNTVRLGVIYKAVEPQPGQINHTYIRKVRGVERTLAKRGIHSLIDFHQDLYNEKFTGEGWPDWAVLDDGLPAEPLTGFPATYITSPGLNRAFDNFYANKTGPGGVRLQRRYANAWAKVAKSFRRDPSVLGYDLLNEPWPGSAFTSCLNAAGCPTFDETALASFYRRVIGAIRGADRRHIVFYEPHVLYNFGAETNLPDLGKNLGFSFHDYCFLGLVSGTPATCPEMEASIFENADARAAKTGDSLMLSEFGATDDLSILRRLTNYADRHMTSWQEWHYCGCDDPTTQGPGDIQAIVKDPRKPPRGSNVFWGKLKALARPYPQAIAGTPIRFNFDPDTRKFELVYTTKRADGSGRFATSISKVFVPRIQYPHGFRTELQNRGLPVDAVKTSRQRLEVVAPPGTVGRVKLTITPKH
ncbi:MAG: cellulase family glycosylhydrolase [Solirubrobacterales bacterium]